MQHKCPMCGCSFNSPYTLPLGHLRFSTSLGKEWILTPDGSLLTIPFATALQRDEQQSPWQHTYENPSETQELPPSQTTSSSGPESLLPPSSELSRDVP